MNFKIKDKQKDLLGRIIMLGIKSENMINPLLIYILQFRYGMQSKLHF